MPPRFHVPLPFCSGSVVELPASTSRHVQVLRLQPGQAVILFNGEGGEWAAEVTQMGRQLVTVRLGERQEVQRELPLAVTLALGMPTNDRMDTVVEKAGELGAHALQPLVCERSVLRLQGERAEKKQAHWQSVAAAASEQCGRVRVTTVAPVRTLRDWLSALPAKPDIELRLLLSPHADQAWRLPEPGVAALLFLSGPEGGLTEAEEHLAQQCGFAAMSLGPRVLRADTAPLAVLAAVALSGVASA
jgi:16S rRNA (uracil1498-N3)-methyltransferase